MTNARFLGNGLPIASTLDERSSEIRFEVFAHGDPIVAKLCYEGKQHFASKNADTQFMKKTPINNVLARNLAHFMNERGLTQAVLSEKSDVAQTTISLYLHPDRRQPGKTGKLPSAKLSEVESLAKALDLGVWELLRDLSPVQRQAYEQIEAAFRKLSSMPDSKLVTDETIANTGQPVVVQRIVADHNQLQTMTDNLTKKLQGAPRKSGGKSRKLK